METSSVLTPSAATELQAKFRRLENCIRGLGRVLVAYSGGVDSAFLAWSAHRIAGNQMLAVIADSPSLARYHLREAVSFCEQHGIPVHILGTRELDQPDYVRNDARRCFHCKNELFTVLEQYGQENGFQAIAYGINVDDKGDYRPGQQAAQAHRVAAPLMEAGLRKDEIRQLARAAGLSVWDKPASACLSSRLEYGRPVTREALQQVEAGEEALRALGFRQFRVRHHGAIARIEIARDELPVALSTEMAERFVSIFKAIGFDYVTLDLEGFRSGSMNAILPVETLASSRLS